MNIFRILAIAVGIIGIVLWILLLGSEEPYTDYMLHLGKGLVWIAAILTLFFTIKNLVAHPDKLKKAIITIVAFLAVVGIAYAVADGTATDQASESASKWATLAFAEPVVKR